MRLQVLEISFGSVMPVGTAVRELLQLAVSAAPKAVGLPPRLTELGGHSVPTMFLYQLLHLREDCFGERARVVLPIPPHLDVNEDAEDVWGKMWGSGFVLCRVEETWR